jgi:site-specific recombinase XerD
MLRSSSVAALSKSAMTHELIDNFVQHLNQSGKSHSTIIAYRKDLEQLFVVVNKEIRHLQKDDLVAALSHLQNQYKFSTKTLSRKLNSFRTFFKFLHSQGHIKHNVAEEVEHPKLTAKPPRVLSQPEYLALREVSRDNLRLHTMIELMLQTGLRIGEVSRLKISDVEFTKTGGTLNVAAFSTIPTRKIQLNARAAQALSTYLASMRNVKPETPLFPTRDGKEMIIRNIRSAVDRAMQKAGIEDASVNDLRNTFIMAQLKAGVPLDVISHTVGHRSKTTTQKYLELLDTPYTPSGDSKVAEL